MLKGLSTGINSEIDCLRACLVGVIIGGMLNWREKSWEKIGVEGVWLEGWNEGENGRVQKKMVLIN